MLCPKFPIEKLILLLTFQAAADLALKPMVIPFAAFQSIITCRSSQICKLPRSFYNVFLNSTLKRSRLRHGVNILEKIKNFFIKVFVFFFKLTLKEQNFTKRNFLIISTTGLGDTLSSTPAIKAVRQTYPGAYI